MASDKTFQELADFARKELTDDENSLRTQVWVKIVLILFVMAYMSWVYVQVGRMDAQFVVEAARGVFATHIDAYKAETIRSLKSSAPTTAKELAAHVQKSVPQWSKALFSYLDGAMKHASGELDKEMDAQITVMIDEEKKQVDAKLPNASPAEKEAKLKEAVIARLSKTTSGLLHAVQVQYGKDLNKLTAELDRLQKNQGLSTKEKYQREALACWVKLIKIQIKKAEKA